MLSFSQHFFMEKSTKCFLFTSCDRMNRKIWKQIDLIFLVGRFSEIRSEHSEKKNNWSINNDNDPFVGRL